ncbi:hypothetical protein Moror_2205 [Moniliophthora roreri MCA 2997]|uniref:Uncharacterized protein n=2 Tax=Moniliophthora roreri TaxID=221103 RepID=V2W3U7_MONRO|nr:hypothetical protein Moror_2205 [Moniliophthora roreri MCA 2997]
MDITLVRNEITIGTQKEQENLVGGFAHNNHAKIEKPEDQEDYQIGQNKLKVKKKKKFKQHKLKKDPNNWTKDQNQKNIKLCQQKDW